MTFDTRGVTFWGVLINVKDPHCKAMLWIFAATGYAVNWYLDSWTTGTGLAVAGIAGVVLWYAYQTGQEAAKEEQMKKEP